MIMTRLYREAATKAERKRKDYSPTLTHFFSLSEADALRDIAVHRDGVGMPISKALLFEIGDGVEGPISRKTGLPDLAAARTLWPGDIAMLPPAGENAVDTRDATHG